MRVRVHPADEGGCGHYRLIWPAEALAAVGVDVTVAIDEEYQVVCLDDLAGRSTLGLIGDPVAFRRLTNAMAQELALAKKVGRDPARITRRYMAEVDDLVAATGRDAVDADVVVLQRVISRDRYGLLRALQRAGAAVVVEIDDDFHAIHPGNPAWKAANPLNDPNVHRDWLMRACADADLVTVTTPALAARYGAHGRVAILDNYVPERYLSTTPGSYTETYLGDWPEQTTIGWTGSTVTHPGDLEVTAGAVAHAATDTGAGIAVVGTGKYVAAALGWDGPVHATGWLPIVAYPEAMRRIDVGIVPLVRSAFNEAKSHLKGLEFAAVGVPFVATPTGPYARLATQGIGTLADTPEDWHRELVRLAGDADHRAEVAMLARQNVAAHWTIEGNAGRWWNAWHDALEHATRRVAA